MGTFVVGLLVCAALSSAASLVSSKAAEQEMRQQFNASCQLVEQLQGLLAASTAQLSNAGTLGQITDNTSTFLEDYGSRLGSLSQTALKATTSYKRTLLVTGIAQAVGVMFFVYLLLRSKEKRDAIFNYL